MFVGIDYLNSRRRCLVNNLYSFDAYWFQICCIAWSGRIRARNDQELLISSEPDLNEFVLVAVVAPRKLMAKGLSRC